MKNSEPKAAFQRQLLRKKELFFLLGLLIFTLFLSLFFLFSPASHIAVAELEGKVVLEEDLSELTAPKQVELEGKNGITLTLLFSPDGAQILSSECRDQTCVKTGKLTRKGECAVCLPARVTLRMQGDPGTDAETY